MNLDDVEHTVGDQQAGKFGPDGARGYVDPADDDLGDGRDEDEQAVNCWEGGKGAKLVRMLGIQI